MKKRNVFAAVAMGGLLTLCSCAKEVMNENGMAGEPDSRLTVMTRADGSGGSMSTGAVVTPIRVYVFSGETCVAMETLETTDEQLSLDLKEGEYDICAIGGANAERLRMPSMEEATQTAEVSVKDGKSLDDLMTGTAKVALTKGKTSTLTLGLERKVCQLKRAVIRSVTEEAENVSIRIAPIYQSVLLDGTLQGTSGSITVELKESESEPGTWELPVGDVYLFPSVGKPTLTVSIDGDSFAYASDKAFEANHRINIEGAYVNSHATLNGTITGSEWESDTDISFTFNEDGSEKAGEGDETTDPTEPGESDGEDEKETGEVPAVGSVYKNCYVLAVDGKKVTLLSPKEEDTIISSDDKTQSQIAEAVNKALTEWEVEGINSTWGLPNNTLAQLIFEQRNSINEKGFIKIPFGDYKYFYMDDNGKIEMFSFTTNTITLHGSPSSKTFLRPVTTLTFE